MARPYVQIDADNQASDLRQHLTAIMPRFVAIHGLVGLTLNGGLSRGYVDHLSEIDVTIFLTQAAFKAWQHCRSPVPAGITILNGQLYDIKYVSYAAERDREWEDVTRWDASYAEILYDPDGLIRALFSQKLVAVDPMTAEGHMMSCWWYFALAGEIWIHRGDSLQGHHMFNQAVTGLVQALFAANREYIPHEKWLLHLSRSLDWRPMDWEKRLNSAMATGDMTIASLHARAAVIRELWEEIDRYLIETYSPDSPVHMMQRSTYEHLKLIVDAQSMTVADWRRQTGRDFPNEDPFHPVIKLEGDQIVIDRDVLLRVGPDVMYSWHHEVLRAAIEGI